MPLTNTQKSLFNCINDIQKAHYEVYGSSDYIYKHKVGYYSAFIYFGVKSLNWNFLEKLKDITDDLIFNISISSASFSSDSSIFSILPILRNFFLALLSIIEVLPPHLI